MLGHNMFTYCRNNPVSRKDAFGFTDVNNKDEEDGKPNNDFGPSHNGGGSGAGHGGGSGSKSGGNGSGGVDGSTRIYRYYSTKDTNLSPRTGIDYDGLSFSSNPPKAGVKSVTTTIDQVNGTGHL